MSNDSESDIFSPGLMSTLLSVVFSAVSVLSFPSGESVGLVSGVFSSSLKFSSFSFSNVSLAFW